MDFNSFADAFSESADLPVHSDGDRDVKQDLTRDEFFYFDTPVFQVTLLTLVINALLTEIADTS
jgi:hypothetical protein